jgi:hypothetical protein
VSQATGSPWFDTKGAAAWCQCSPKTLGRAVKAGRLRAIRLEGGPRLRFNVTWLEDWLLAEGGDAQDRQTPAESAKADGIRPDSSVSGARGRKRGRPRAADVKVQ